MLRTGPSIKRSGRLAHLFGLRTVLTESLGSTGVLTGMLFCYLVIGTLPVVEFMIHVYLCYGWLTAI